MPHCQQWVLMPIYLCLCGTNPSVHSQTIKVNPRVLRRTTAASWHNMLSTEALTGYQSQNKARATGLWKPKFIKQEATQYGWTKYLQVRDGSRLKNICTKLPCFIKTYAKLLFSQGNGSQIIFWVRKLEFTVYTIYYIICTVHKLYFLTMN